MNVQIVSNTPNLVGSENFNNDFVMPLPEVIDGENEKKTIRVPNVSYPLTIENVEENSCGIRIHYHFSLFQQTGLIDASIKYSSNWIYLPAGYYTVGHMVASINSFVNEYELFFTVLNGGRIGVSFNVGKMQIAVQKTPTDQFTYTPLKGVYLLVECRGLNVEGEGKKSRARVKSRW
jgi:hypothetical protein